MRPKEKLCLIKIEKHLKEKFPNVFEPHLDWVDIDNTYGNANIMHKGINITLTIDNILFKIEYFVKLGNNNEYNKKMERWLLEYFDKHTNFSVNYIKISS